MSRQGSLQWGPGTQADYWRRNSLAPKAGVAGAAPKAEGVVVAAPKVGVARPLPNAELAGVVGAAPKAGAGLAPNAEGAVLVDGAAPKRRSGSPGGSKRRGRGGGPKSGSCTKGWRGLRGSSEKRHLAETIPGVGLKGRSVAEASSG